MEKETSICEAIENIGKHADALKDKLDEISHLLDKKMGIRVNFCEIFSYRWAFLAGVDEVVIPRHRIILTPRYGLISENLCPEDAEGLEIIETIRKNILLGETEK